MSQEERNSTISSNEPTSLTQRESGEVSVLSSIDERIKQADNPQERDQLAEVRGKIMLQDEEAKDRKHRRRLDKIQLLCQIGLPLIIFAVGIGMLIYGSKLGGAIILGAGVTVMKTFLGSSRGKGKGGKNAEESSSI